MTATQFFNDQVERQKYVDLTRQEAETFYRTNSDAILSLKYDGIWGALVIDGLSTVSQLSNSNSTIYSRTKSIKAVNYLSDFPCTDQVILLGEYMYGQEWANHPSRVGKFFAYDCIYDQVDLRSLPYEERYERLLAFCNGCGAHSKINVIPYVEASRAGLVLDELYKTNSFEGIVLRSKSGTYFHPSYRHKTSSTDDFVISGWSMAEDGQFAGSLGALRVSQYCEGELVEICRVGGGFTPEERNALWEDRENLIGKVVEISFSKRFASGSLRHPNFVRFRSDKKPTDCIYDL